MGLNYPKPTPGPSPQRGGEQEKIGDFAAHLCRKIHKPFTSPPSRWEEDEGMGRFGKMPFLKCKLIYVPSRVRQKKRLYFIFLRMPKIVSGGTLTIMI